jgi:betaine-homocysteine S-methyltransferase
MGSLGTARDHIAEQIRLLKDAGVDFLILETFFHLAEMKVALEAAAESGLATIATMSFRPLVTQCSDGYAPAECARQMADLGAVAVGANCEQDPERMLPLLREMQRAAETPLAAQPAAFCTTDECHSFTRLAAFPDDLETIQVSRKRFVEFGRAARSEGIGFVGGCCGANAAYIRALAQGLRAMKD